MIARYFLIFEALGYLGIAFMLINIVFIATYYVCLLSSSKRETSYYWLTANLMLSIGQIILFALFITALVNPEIFAGRGKLEKETAVSFIEIVIFELVLSIVSFVLNQTTGYYWGAKIVAGKIWIYFACYKSDDILEKKNFYFFGRQKKWKHVVKKSKTGHAIRGFFKL